MKVLDELVEGIKSHFPDIGSDAFRAGSKPSELLGKFEEDLRRARKEFDALMFFTVCFGMLKSGKSTLVNLLAGHADASPSRFGQDTTLRPCLLLGGEKDELTMFHLKDSFKADDTGKAEKKCFNAVIDFLRGVIDEDQLRAEHHVVTKIEPFSEDNIFRAVCSPEGFGSEPLITVVRIENASELMQSEIAILDVPGLDSDQMKPENSRYLELLDRCDLLLFIQSTVSALNHEAAGMLKELVRRSKGSPIWLIQNRFEAQNWRKSEVIEAQDNELAKTARANLANALGVRERLIFSKQVNLGKAYDATFREALLDEGCSPDALLGESRFDKVVEELSSKINEERLDIQLTNCLNQLRNTVANNKKLLDELEDWILEEKKSLYAYRDVFDRLIERLSSQGGFVPILESNDDPGSFHDETQKTIKNWGDRWRNKVQTDLDKWKTGIPDKTEGDAFNQQIKKKIQALFATGPNDFLSPQSSFGSRIAEIFRKVIESSPQYRSLIQECQDAMRDFEAPLLDQHIAQWKGEGGPYLLDVEPILPASVDGGRHLRIFMKKKISADICRMKIDEAGEALRKAIGSYLHALQTDEVARWFREYRDAQVAEYFIGQIRERRQAKEEDAMKLEQGLDHLAGRLPGLRQALDRFEDFTNAFRTRYNLT